MTSRAILNGWPLGVGQPVGPQPLTISGTPAAATQGTAYTFTPTTTGGSGTKTFALSGALPAGLSFSTSTGAITGTPTATGTASGLSITVTDAAGATATLSGLLIVVSAVAQLPTLRRAAITSVTDNGATTADSAKIAASSANKRNGTVTLQANTAREFIIALGAAPAAVDGKGLAYFEANLMPTASWQAMTVNYSTDGGTSYQAATSNLFVPANAVQYSGRGQHWTYPKTATHLKINVNSSAQTSFDVGVIWTMADPKLNAIFGTFHTSIGQQAHSARDVINQANALNPSGDVLYFNWGRTGGKLQAIYDETVTQVPAKASSVYYWAGFPYTNEIFQGTRTIAPAVYAGDASAAKSNITSLSAQFKSYAAANGFQVEMGDLTFADYLVNSPGTSGNPPAVDQAGANGGPFPANGNAPFENNEIFAALSSDMVDPDTGYPRPWTFFRSLATNPDWAVSSDRLHPAGPGSYLHRQDVAEWITARCTGSWPTPAPTALIALYEGNQAIPAGAKSAITYALGQAPAAQNASQTSARNALSSRLAALPTSYTDPALANGAVLPSSLNGIKDWWDFAKFDTMVAGASSNLNLTPSALSVVGAVAQVPSRGPLGSTLQNTTAAGRPTYTPRAAPSGDRGGLAFAGPYQVLGSGLSAVSGAGIISALDAGGRDLILTMHMQVANLYQTIWAFEAGAANLRVLNLGYGKVQVQDGGTGFLTDNGTDLVLGTHAILCIACLNGAWAIYLNDPANSTASARATATKTLTARTGSSFSAFGSIGRSQGAIVQVAAPGTLVQADAAAAVLSMRNLTKAF